ncbi:AlpA family transcriptional regulator [Yersinia enterocolitica]|uniref:helix-turn-helix transcriptional regulator n=1 Tax=Yersinia enterocolitica TaxID=630 RepID=UPI0005DF9889|nr:AlpA family transcriptional regulator [Yersinia enterocolitica]CQH58350.1 AlpA family transcriptional regulator [Yersinia enterocolitica]CQH58382.1 AlpA family transcriptional regulator [Yersinia enterocolitica]CQH58411.1 AlpA family transcriptional regulator [Yersinia enterocolitica]CQH58444.1 AlpA family transcriptional regulator [Yersinia enterocolitica]
MLAMTQQALSNTPPPMATHYPRDRFMRLPEVINTTALSRSTIYELISRDHFPAQISLGGKNVAWLASEIESWMAERIANRQGVSA